MHRAYWDEWLAQMHDELPALPPVFFKEMISRGHSTILDVGSGRGISITACAHLGFRVVCVDSSLRAVHHLHSISRRSSLQKMHVVCADLLHLPFHREQFGAVTSFNVLNFITKKSQRKKACRELVHMVVPGGILFLVMLSSQNEGARRGTPVGENVQLPDGIKLHYYTPAEVEELLDNTALLLLECVESADTTHGVHHSHSLIRVLACRL